MQITFCQKLQVLIGNSYIVRNKKFKNARNLSLNEVFHNFWFLNETKVTRQPPIGKDLRLSNVYSIKAKYA